MKSFFTFCCCLLALQSFAVRTVFCGKVADKNVQYLRLQYYRDPIAYIESNTDSMKALLDKEGNFRFQLELDHPISFNLSDGTNWLTLYKYLSPGDSLVLNFSNDDIKIDGSCQDCNATLFQLEQNFWANSVKRDKREQAEGLPSLAFAAAADSDRQEQLQFITTYTSDKMVNNMFLKYCEAQVNYQIMNKLLQRSWARPKLLADPHYLNYLRKVPAMDDSAFTSDNYLNYLRELPYSSWNSCLIEDKGKSYQENRILHPQTAYYEDNQYSLRDSVARTYFTGKAYDIALYSILYDMLKAVTYAKGTDAFSSRYAHTDSLLSSYSRSFNDARLYTRLQEKLAEQKVVQVATDFELADWNGKKVKLSDFRGKVVYVDFWATNCAPCMAELPQFKKLEAHFKGQSDIVFLSVSMGDTRNKLMPLVKAGRLTGVLLLCPEGMASPVASAYHIMSFPRYLVIDKNGKLISDNAPRPSFGPEALLEKALAN